MKKDLILEQGTLFKKAQGQPGQGPSFEQQFGILANAQIVDKYPSLGDSKVAFQMLDKDEQNTYAAGAAVYQLGNSFIYIPAVFRNGKIATGQMMYVNDMYRFLPLSDAWMSYIKNKNVTEVGDTIPAELGTDIAASPAQAMAKDVTDPIMKTASVPWGTVKKKDKVTKAVEAGLTQDPTDFSLRNSMSKAGIGAKVDATGKLHTYKQGEKKPLGFTVKASLSTWDNTKAIAALTSPGAPIKTNIFLDAIKLGKKASMCMLDMLNNNDYINAALQHYGPEVIGQFAKTASIVFPQQQPPHIVNVLDKEASTLSADQLEELHRDGYIIKTATQRVSDGPATEVLSYNDVKTIAHQFAGVGKSCKCKLLTESGDLDQVTVIKAPLSCDCGGDLCRDYTPNKYAGNFGRNNDIPAKKPSSEDLYVIVNGKAQRLSGEVPQALVSSIQDVDFSAIGSPLSSHDKLPWDTIVVTPSGTAFRLPDSFQKAQDGSFFSFSTTLKEAGEDDLVQPMKWKNSIVVPKGSRVIFPAETKDKSAKHYVVTSDLGVSINKFITKQYDKLKVYSNGSDVMVSGNKSKDQYMTQKKAALHLVTNYAIEPALAKSLVKTAVDASQVRPVANTYLIKVAVAQDSPMWQDSDIGMTQLTNQNEPNIDKTSLDGYQAENPAEVMAAIQNATNNGVKQVFDMETLKLLIQVADPIQEISEVIPDFMNTLDKLCRLLFLYRCHTTDMEEQYGQVKMRALEQSLQNTLKDLSQLTVFLKLRGINNTPDNSPDVGELQTGSML